MPTGKPLIILGAGASHDFVQDDQRHLPTLPLTDHLVRRDTLDQNLLQRYREAADVFSAVAPLVTRKDKPLSLEDALSNVTDHSEMAALRFYLSDIFTSLSGSLSTERVNNYRALIRYIRNSPARGASVITFNYDTLFESQLGDWPYRDVRDYVSDGKDIQLFKLHGSSDWSYVQRIRDYDEDRGIRNGYDFFKRNPKYTGEAIYTKIALDESSGSGDFYRIPALAIPVTGEKSFVLPTADMPLLEKSVKNASKILIIGWKGADSLLLKLMQEWIQGPVPVFLVTGPSGGKELSENLSALLGRVTIAGEERGFSNFIANGTMAKTFFS